MAAVSQQCLLLFVAVMAAVSFSTMTTTAFTVPMQQGTSIVRHKRTTFVSSTVYMSDETTETAAVTAAAAAPAESEAAPVEAVAADPVEAVAADPIEAVPADALELTAEERAAKRKIQRERHTLFIGNLPFDTSDTDIKAMFEPHGKVDLVNIPRDRVTQKPRGFAFVDMGSAEELEAAIAAVDGTTFAERQVRVTKSVAKGEVEKTRKPRGEGGNGNGANAPQADGTKKIYMGNIPFTATKDDVKDIFSPHGDVLEVFIPQNPDSGTGRGFAFVTMNEADVDKAIEATNGMEFGGRTLVVNEPLPPGKKANRKMGRTKLYIGNLSFYTVAETLEDIFGEFGEIIDCYLPEDPSTGGSRGFGFVTMAREDALMAIKELDGCEVDGRVIRVNEAQPKGAPGGGRNGNGDNDMSDDETDVISGSWDNVDNE